MEEYLLRAATNWFDGSTEDDAELVRELYCHIQTHDICAINLLILVHLRLLNHALSPQTQPQIIPAVHGLECHHICLLLLYLLH